MHNETDNIPSGACGSRVTANHILSGIYVRAHSDDAVGLLLATSAQVAIAENAGVTMFTDDPEKAAALVSVARESDRTADLRILDLRREGDEETLHPLAHLTVSEITDLMGKIVAAADPAPKVGPYRQKILCQAAAGLFVAHSGREGTSLQSLRKSLRMERFLPILDDRERNIPTATRETGRAYLEALPGFNDEKGYKQSHSMIEWHQGASGELSSALAYLASLPAFYDRPGRGQIDLDEIIRSRRILIVITPRIHKEPLDHLASRIVAWRLGRAMKNAPGTSQTNTPTLEHALIFALQNATDIWDEMDIDRRKPAGVGFVSIRSLGEHTRMGASLIGAASGSAKLVTHSGQVTSDDGVDVDVIDTIADHSLASAARTCLRWDKQDSWRSHTATGRAAEFAETIVENTQAALGVKEYSVFKSLCQDLPASHSSKTMIQRSLAMLAFFDTEKVEFLRTRKSDESVEFGTTADDRNAETFFMVGADQ